VGVEARRVRCLAEDEEGLVRSLSLAAVLGRQDDLDGVLCSEREGVLQGHGRGEAAHQT
jgi:hypothetical protein